MLSAFILGQSQSYICKCRLADYNLRYHRKHASGVGPVCYSFSSEKQVVIPQNTKMMVQLPKLQAILFYWLLHPNALKSCSTLLASGMADTVPSKSFCKLIANFSTKLTSLPRHMLVAVGTYLPKVVGHFRPDDISPGRKVKKIVSIYRLRRKEDNRPSHRLRFAEKENVGVLYVL